MAVPPPLRMPMSPQDELQNLQRMRSAAFGSQPQTDEEQAQAALEAINQQIQGLGGQAPEPMGPPGFLERLFNSGAGEPTFQPMGFFQGLLQGGASGLASRGQKVAQKRQQIESLIEAQRQQNQQQQLQDLQAKRAAAIKEIGDIRSEGRAAANQPPVAIMGARGKPVFVTRKEALGKEPASSAADLSAIALSPAGLEVAARMYSTTGMLPPMGMGKATAGVRTKIINRAAEIDPTLDIASNKAGFESTKSALTNLRKIHSAAKAFEGTALKNAGVLEGTVKKLTDTGSPWLNRPIRSLQAGALGDPDVSAFRAALQTVTPEFARLLSSPTASGQLSDTAREEIQSILSPDATPAQIVASLNVLRQDASNRTSSYASQIKDLEYEIAHHGESAPAEIATTQAPAQFRFDPKTGTVVPVGK